MSTTASSTPNTAPAAPVDVPASAAMPPPPLPAPAAPENAAAASSSLSDLQTLRNHIQTLTELNSRVQALRQAPAVVLRPPPTTPEAVPRTTVLGEQFKELHAIVEKVRSEQVQAALKAARKSEAAEPKLVGFDIRRDNLKRRRPPSPESPQPYRAAGSKGSSLLPQGDINVPPVRLDGLPAYIREHNRSNPNKLHVVAPKKGQPLECPVVLRFVVPDVLVVYLTLGHSSTEEQSLVVESATVFGPREQKATHSQSDFTVYQQLSQRLARVLQSEPWAPLQAIMSLLGSYANLFTDPCTICGRVLSSEVHTPPMVRLWKEPTADSPAEWEVRHVACKPQ